MEKRRRKSMDDHVPKETKRKKMKPITEKLRRERINNSLEELKFLILSASDEDMSSYTKMEKADILEMTVNYIRRLQGDQKVQKPSLVTYGAAEVFCPDKLHKQPETTPLCLSLPSINHSEALERIPIETSFVADAELTVESPSNETNTRFKPFSCCTILEVNDSSVSEISVTDSPRAKLTTRQPFFPRLSYHSTTHFDYSRRQLSPNKVVDIGHAQKVRLPGMESFVQNRFRRDFLLGETDKENSYTAGIAFNQQVCNGWQKPFDGSQSTFRTEVNDFNSRTFFAIDG